MNNIEPKKTEPDEEFWEQDDFYRNMGELQAEMDEALLWDI